GPRQPSDEGELGQPWADGATAGRRRAGCAGEGPPGRLRAALAMIPGHDARRPRPPCDGAHRRTKESVAMWCRAVVVFAVVAGGAVLDGDGGRHRARSSDTAARHDPDAAARQASVARSGWPALHAASPAELCVTSGAARPVDRWGFAVDHPMTRAVLTVM